jgi:hypothetical protein
MRPFIASLFADSCPAMLEIATQSSRLLRAVMNGRANETPSGGCALGFGRIWELTDAFFCERPLEIRAAAWK